MPWTTGKSHVADCRSSCSSTSTAARTPSLTLRRNVDDLEAIALAPARAARTRPTRRSARHASSARSSPCPSRSLPHWSRRDECATRRSAGGPRRQAASIPFCLSTVSACSPAEVAGATGKPLWFQLYMIRDRAFMKDLLAEARRASCSRIGVHGRYAGARPALS